MPHVAHPFLPLLERAPFSLFTAPPSSHESGHAFVDDLLYRSESGDRRQQIFNFFDTVARGWDLDLKSVKPTDLPLGHPPINNQPENWATTPIL